MSLLTPLFSALMAAPRPSDVVLRRRHIDLFQADTWQGLARRFEGADRYYHTWDHALDVLHRVDVVQQCLGWQDYDAAVYAALYHDIVYRPTAGRGTNESDSLAALPDEFSARAAYMILATAHHGYGNRTELSWDVGLFLDCDMAGFAAPDDVFDVQNIDLDDEARAHTSPEAYRAKRVPWLQQVQRNGVFMTPLFRAWGEAVAQRNLDRELGRVPSWMDRAR